ncbi:hypothetical protein B9Q02_10865 [Candidatus Marsarchaeota G1 archaeon BE_D]|jgi:amino acid transporter|uniref:Amino acid permease/ SLC12A domain-containing protein n=1 Tax=Candidatus Marsarchaeota G1 archaeon BE_D TaxID=1978156 RepID=A0A2R6A9P7_9ARCH|nr:MAG: hypothetical protein B9Q02_10865 [Candidatus Marsarchaeota G1 archaeon BE_D]
MSKPAGFFVRESTGLTKQISGLEALAMALSGMGLLYVFNVIAFVPAFYPDANPLMQPFIGLLLVLPFAFMYTLLAIGIPRTGGDYIWTSRILNPWIGFVSNFTITMLSLSFIGSVGPWIPQWSLGEMFYDLGVLLHKQSYFTIANNLQAPFTIFWVTALFTILAGVIVLISTKIATAIVKYWTILAIVIGIIFIATVLSAGRTTFIRNFNAFSGSNYNEVIAEGQALGAYNGVPPAFSFSSFYAGALGLLAYLAWFYPAYFAGEVRQNKTTQILAQIGGVVIFAIFTEVMVAVEYYGEGPAFANAMAALWINGSPKYPYINIPLASGLSMYWTQNPVLVAIFNISFGITVFVMSVSILFSMSRNIFAWSFDRILPSFFASLNSKTRTPANAIAIMTIVGLIYLYLAVFNYGSLAEVFSYGTAGIFIAFLFVSFAAMIFPYVKRDIFEKTDSLVKKRIGSIPLITIIGVICVIISLVTVYSIVLPAIGGSFFYVFFTGIIPTFIIALIIYGIAFVVRKKQNIDLNVVFKEIPPE